MTDFEKLAKEKLRLLNKSEAALSDGIIKAQRDLWEAVLSKIEGLEVKEGRIIQTKKNIAIIEEVSELMKSSLTSIDYRKALISFVQDLDLSAKISNKIVALIQPFSPTDVQKQFLEVAKRGAVQTLLGENITGSATNEIRDALTASIASGSSFKETIKALKPIIVGTDKADGKLLAKVRTYAKTTQSVVDRSYTNIIALSVGAEWYFYQGSEIKTTRKFCAERHDQYFHKKEIEAWGKGNDPTNIGGINAEGNWNGKIANTNEFTIFSLAGGWECRHSILPVTVDTVPDTVIQRAILAGFYKES